jgi:ribonuclease D
MHYVDTPAALECACRACAAAGAVALDTEFERSVTYHPRPALIQLGDGARIWLLDPLALADLEPLGELLDHDPPLKIMHSVLEDLSVLRRATGREPASVFDTQLAAALAGVGFGLGYHALVKELLGVEVSKDQTRSDWLQRPLSDAQLAYAATDVAHLHALHRLLAARLHELGRSGWLDEETQRLRQRSGEDDSQRDYLRLADRVPDDRARGVLHALCAWRNQEAQQRDRPRRHIADDPLLVALASARPDTPAALENLPAWRIHRGRARAAALLGALAQAQDAPHQPLPPGAADLRAHRRALDCLKRAVAEVAAATGIAAALLAPRRMLEQAVIHARLQGRPGLPEEFGGWRAALLEAPVLACLHDG